MRANDIHLLALDYAKSTFDTSSSVCRPLLELNITKLTYIRLFNNGRYLSLCNDLNSAESAIRQIDSYDHLEFDNPIIHSVLRDIDGWPSIYSTLSKDIPSKANQFIKRHKYYFKRFSCPPREE